MKKYFPIQSDTACRTKWAWSTVYLTDGETASCHRASTAQITEENFFDFHNLPNKIEDRKKMLQGEWPENGCEYCKDVELNGGFSDRQFQLTIPNNYPLELDVDRTAVNVAPTILEVFFKNTCNLLCVYCSEKYSSSIQKENKKYGYINIENKRDVLLNNNYDKLSPLLWQWLETNFKSLKRLHILGGEPLLQDDFFRLLEFIEQNPNPNLELAIISNLAIKEKVLKNCFDKIKNLIAHKKIKRVEVQASIDGWGPGQEYIRSGLELAVFDRNFTYLLGLSFLRLSILSTITSLSIPELPALAEKINKWKKTRKISWYMHTVLPHGESVFDSAIFNYSIFKNSLETVYKLLPNTDFDENSTKEMLAGIMSSLKDCKGDDKKQINLIKMLNQIDARRNYNWRATFPWLSHVVQ